MARDLLWAAGMRMLGWLLAAYAAIGLVLVVAAFLVGGPLVSRLDRLSTAATTTMAAAAEAADAAADAFGGFDASLGEARRSASDAASLSRETSATLDALAAAMSLSIFGTQPLLPLADQFSASAQQLRQMGDNLDQIGEALVANQSDIARVGVRMRTLADRLGSFQARLGSERLTGDLPLGWLFYGFVLWQLLPIVAAGIGAAWLLRHTRTVLVPDRPTPEP